MAEIPLTIKIPPAARDRLRDHLIDTLRTKSLERFVQDQVGAIMKAKAVPGDYIQRRLWCLAQLHTRDELRRMTHECVAMLAPPPGPVESEPLSGQDPTYSEASLWDAWFGQTYIGTYGGGIDSLSAEELGWGDTVGNYGFDSQQAAEDFAEAMDDAGFPVAGPIHGTDGQWHVYVNLDGSN